MPAFVKTPKFIIGTLVVLWVIYVVYANFQPRTVDFYLLPYFLTLQVRLSAVIIGSGVFGVGATVVVQYFWRRRSSKNASSAAPTSSSTVA
jgi:hypothetical protein